MRDESRKYITATAISVALILGSLHFAQGAKLCEMCKKQIVAGLEVTVRELKRNEKHSYRCIICAATAMSSKYPNSKAEANSPISGKRITLQRSGDKWSCSPKEAVLLILPKDGGDCLKKHQPFVNETEFNLYLRKNPELKKLRPKPYPLNRIEQLLKERTLSGGKVKKKTVSA